MKIYWFQAGDETPFPIEEEGQAWEQYQSRGNWRRKDIKYLGVTDGSIYLQAVKDKTSLKEASVAEGAVADISVKPRNKDVMIGSSNSQQSIDVIKKNFGI